MSIAILKDKQSNLIKLNQLNTDELTLNGTTIYNIKETVNCVLEFGTYSSTINVKLAKTGCICQIVYPEFQITSVQNSDIKIIFPANKLQELGFYTPLNKQAVVQHQIDGGNYERSRISIDGPNGYLWIFSAEAMSFNVTSNIKISGGEISFIV